MLTDLHEMTVGMENKLNLDLTIEPMRQIQDEAEYRTWDFEEKNAYQCIGNQDGTVCNSFIDQIQTETLHPHQISASPKKMEETGSEPLCTVHIKTKIWNRCL